MDVFGAIFNGVVDTIVIDENPKWQKLKPWLLFTLQVLSQFFRSLLSWTTLFPEYSRLYVFTTKERVNFIRGLSAIDLLEITSSRQLLFIFKILSTFFTKQATLTRRSTVMSLLLQLALPEFSIVLMEIQ
jgi:hypothetical protein